MIGLFEQLFPIVVIIYSVISKLNIIINFSVVLKYASMYWQQNFYDSAMKTYHCSFISKNKLYENASLLIEGVLGKKAALILK